jgi:hypothetical protein
MNQSLAKIQIIVDSEAELMQFKRSNKVSYLVKEAPELAIKLGADGILAMDIADCKNWEMKGVDFIQFLLAENDSQDKVILGAELLQDMIPREEAYGWMIMSLNTPVFGLGLANKDELANLLSKASIYGLVLTQQFEQNLSLEERITIASNLLD